MRLFPAARREPFNQLRQLPRRLKLSPLRGRAPSPSPTAANRARRPIPKKSSPVRPALAPFTRSAAVSDCRVSIRMSSGPSCWKLNPALRRIQLRRTHAQIQQHAVATRRRNPVRPIPQNCRGGFQIVRRTPPAARRAASTAAPSRSHPNSHPVGELAAKMLAACPAPPSVPSA